MVIKNGQILEVFQLGYKKMEMEARIGEEFLIELKLEPLPSPDVLVTADSLVSEDRTQKTVTLKKMDVYTLPGTSADPVYASQILPGVNSFPDSSSMLIRGGSSDEVAYYFDGIEIDNPFLTGSLHEAYFSIFDNQVIEGFSVSTSGFHTKFGDALSGVMNINGSKNFNFHKRLFVFYFGITNLLNRKNILRYEYSSDYSVRSNSYSIFGRSIFVGIYIPFF